MGENKGEDQKIVRILVSVESELRPVYLSWGKPLWSTLLVPRILWSEGNEGGRMYIGLLPELHAIIKTTLSMT
jgi:hypothetical protein